MKLDKKSIRPFILPLVSFTGDRIVPGGIVTLTVITGTYLAQVNKDTNFLIVNCPSTYNIILERPALNKLRTVMLTYHLKVKFPIAHGVGEIRRPSSSMRVLSSCPSIGKEPHIGYH